MCGAAQWKHVTVRRGSGDAGPFVFGAFSSHLYRSHTIVSVLAVSGVQLAELTQTSWNFDPSEALQADGRVSCLLL